MQSTAGGWAFVDSHPSKSARIVESALDSGLILVGKANLSVRQTKAYSFGRADDRSNLVIGSKDAMSMVL